MTEENTPSKPHKILVVDDEPDLQVLVRQRFRRSIRNGEFDFSFALNGVEALAKLREDGEISVVLTDINMPQMDGLTLLHELRALNEETGQCAKAVVVSAYGDLENIRTAMNRGAFDFLMKPIDFNDVEITLSKTLEYVAQTRQSRLAEEFRIAKEIAEANFSQLQALEALRESLTHMIVHDLRTPLTAMIGGLQSLPSFGDLSPLQLEVLQISMDGAENLLNMVNDLLTISKMESGTLEISSKEMHAHEIAGRAVEQVQALAQDKKIDLSLNLTDEMPMLRADEDLVSRILVNLLGNAIKFTPHGGTISVRAWHDAGSNEMHFTVKDSGRGIPPEAFERIFDKFGQVEGGTGHRTSTGLGLTFCKMAVEAHQGRIWVESELGQGSTFLFALPCP